MSTQTFLPLPHEIIVDNFAGGGGASTGIEIGIGRQVDIAINHDPEAIGMHQVNHPGTTHYCESVWKVNPLEITKGQPVGLAWFSPDCKHFSKAKGGKPVDKRIRGLAWVVVRWATRVKPRVIMLENVEEFQTWGPLVQGEDGRMYPCPDRKGLTFRIWWEQLESLGYRIEMRELRACDYGAPTIRKRLFIIARRDGLPIVWPKPTHGDPKSEAVRKGRLKPWRAAAECIDWSIPCPSIFERERPLADATCRRIAKGIQRYVINNCDPFIVPITHRGADRVSDITEPMRTITTAHRGEFALVAAFLAKHYTGVVGSDLRDPMATVTSVDHHSLVASHMIKLRGTCKDGQSLPAPTITAGGTHIGEVRAFLIKYYGEGGQHADLREPMHTIPTRDRMGLVTVAGEQYQIADIGMRMLDPRELYRAQGFPEHYIIDRTADGQKLSKTAQVRMCGNSVSPNIAAALVEANFVHERLYAGAVA